MTRYNVNPSVQNADYIFPDAKIILELKIIETEVGNTDQFRAKMDIANRRLFEKHGKTPLSMDPQISADYLKAFIDLYRAPLARIVKKANAQINRRKKFLATMIIAASYCWLMMDSGNFLRVWCWERSAGY